MRALRFLTGLVISIVFNGFVFLLTITLAEEFFVEYLRVDSGFTFWIAAALLVPVAILETKLVRRKERERYVLLGILSGFFLAPVIVLIVIFSSIT